MTTDTTSKALQVSGVEAVSVQIVDSMHVAKAQAIETAGCISAVKNKLQATLAASALRELSKILRDVESSRKQVKEPVLTLGRSIDAAAATFIAPVQIEAERLKQLLTGFEVEQQRVADEAERARREEDRKRQEEERRRIEQAAEEKRKAEEAAAEANRKARAAENAEQRAQALRDAEAAEKARLEAEAKRSAEEHAAALRKSQESKQPVLFAPAKVAGTVVRKSWTYELQDVRALYVARPELCDITPRRASILEAIRNGAREIPGLRIYEDTRVGVRS